MSKQHDYWKKREDEAHKNVIRSDALRERLIEQIYTDAISRIEKEIQAFYGRYATKEGITIAEAMKRADTLDIKAYEAKAKRYVAEKNLSKEANAQMRLYNLTMKVNRLELLKSNIGLELIKMGVDLDDLMKNAVTDDARREFERLAGILGDTVTNSTKAVQSIIDSSFHNATFSQRIWSNQAVLKAQLDQLLQQHLIQGRGSYELSRQLQKAMGVNKGVADRIMRTECCNARIEAQMRSFKENGYDKYMFIALQEGQRKKNQRRACEHCAELDGKTFFIKDKIAGVNAPPMHPNCRCSTSAFFMESDAFDDWLKKEAKRLNG